MAASAPTRMLLLIDENVPNSVAGFLADRGHDVRFVRELFPIHTSNDSNQSQWNEVNSNARLPGP